MQAPKSNLLEFHPHTVEFVRKGINLEKEDDMKQVIKILREWVEMQPHFKKKDFADSYLESCIITAKGSVEKAKQRLDKMCTMKTLMPEFFEVIDPSKDFSKLFDIATLAICPKLTKEHYRVFTMKMTRNPSEPIQITLIYKYSIFISEYLRKHDYVEGFRIIYDLNALDMVKYAACINIVELRQAFSILMDGYGMKVKGIHLITQSKAIDLLINILKQILSPKLSSRIHTHRSGDELHDMVGKEVLPAEFGGYERPMREIHDEWVKALSSEENMKYMREMREAKTDENLRRSDTFNEEYAGMPGTFRVLSVD